MDQESEQLYITNIITEEDLIPPEFLCPITLELMKDPVICDDGYTYERIAILSTTDSLSPMTRQPIDKSKVLPNRA